MEEKETNITAFAGSRIIASGSRLAVALQTKQSIDAGEPESILIFDDETSEVIEIDFRGSIQLFQERLNHHVAEIASQLENSSNTESGARGRGRPKLGVVAREVTLLPKHWEWLNSQPGGASVALRKLVEEAKRANVYKDVRRAAQNSTYKFMSAMAGNLGGFEEATRSFFAGDSATFFEQIENWPADIKAHIKKISVRAFAPISHA